MVLTVSPVRNGTVAVCVDTAWRKSRGRDDGTPPNSLASCSEPRSAAACGCCAVPSRRDLRRRTGSERARLCGRWAGAGDKQRPVPGAGRRAVRRGIAGASEFTGGLGSSVRSLAWSSLAAARMHWRRRLGPFLACRGGVHLGHVAPIGKVPADTKDRRQCSAGLMVFGQLVRERPMGSVGSSRGSLPRPHGAHHLPCSPAARRWRARR